MAPRRYDRRRRDEAMAAVRARIVDAVVELHAEIGPSRTTYAMIAQKADVAIPTVYKHFPTLAGIVRNVDHADQLELATSLDVQDDAGDWAVDALLVVTRVQAVEARHLAQSNALARVGLVPAVDLEASVPTELTLRRGNLLHRRRTSLLVERCWGEPEMSACVEVLKTLDTLEDHSVVPPSVHDEAAVDEAIDDAIEAAIAARRKAPG